MKYIDADKLKAEIDNLESFSCISEEQDGFYSAIGRVIDIIDSLQQEQQKVNWEEEDELEREINNAGMAMTEHIPSWKEVEQFARHFYELGKNSRKV